MITAPHNPATTKLAAILRGACNRCPNCGKGKLFKSFLKTVEQCSVCGEELSHHRADDLPAYIIILILGHILIPGVVWVELAYSPSYWVHAVIWLPVTLVVAIGLLQPVKGAVVAVEWYLGLQGFHDAKQRRAAITSAQLPDTNH